MKNEREYLDYLKGSFRYKRFNQVFVFYIKCESKEDAKYFEGSIMGSRSFELFKNRYMGGLYGFDDATDRMYNEPRLGLGRITSVKVF
jgi:hypothetical protein